MADPRDPSTEIVLATYHDFEIRYDPRPYLPLSLAYVWSHPDYEGPGDNRCGRAASLVSCMDAIDEVGDV